MDIDPEIPGKENPFEPADTGDDIGEFIPMTSSQRGSEDITNPFSHHRETSFIEGIDEHTPLIHMESKQDEAWYIIKRKFPNANTANSSFTATLDEYDQVKVKLKRMGGKSYNLLDSSGELNEKLPKKIKDSLGPTSEEIVESNKQEISRREEKIKELKSQSQSENISLNIEEQTREIEQLERENEVIEERISLRDRVKSIFKKYGFTFVAVVTAVGVVIGVIVSNLKKGLTSVAKGLGNGLKAIGKRIGEILPGMIGAIASFIFKTAGEAIVFLSKNAWLLIVAVVLYLVEQFKKKSR